MATRNATNIALLVGAGIVLAGFGGVMSKHVADYPREYGRLMQVAEQRGELLGSSAQIIPVDTGAA